MDLHKENQLAQRLNNLFAGLQRSHGKHIPERNVTEGRKAKGQSVTVPGPPTAALWQLHIEGKQGIGIVPINDQDLCSFGAIDIDVYADLDHAAIAQQLQELNLPLFVCRSKSGGLHAYLFTDSPVPAWKMQAKLKQIATAIGHAITETFPKQGKLNQNSKGSWINGPYFDSDKGNRHCVRPDGSAMTLAEFLDAAERSKVGLEFFEGIDETTEPHAAKSKPDGPRPWDDPNWRGVSKEQLCKEAHAIKDAGTKGWKDSGYYLSAQMLNERWPREEALAFYAKHWWAECSAVDTGDGYSWEVALETFESAYSHPPRDPRAALQVETKSGKPKKENQTDILLGMAEDFELLNSGPAGDAYVRLTVGNHKETWAVSAKSPKIREILTCRFFAQRHRAPSREALSSAVDTVLAQCSMGRRVDTHVRFARSKDAIFLDLCDDQWRAVEITKDGWRVVENPPVFFRRPSGAQPLPLPTQSGSLEPLRGLLNCGDDSQWQLMLAWLIGTFLPEGAFSHLVLEGEQGSAKSTTARILQSMLDPSDGGLSSPPRNEADATISAMNTGLLGYDNLSGCKAELADIFCRFSTGQGYKTRTLFETMGLTVASVKLPILLNGIDSTVMRGDLLDRSISLTLPRITPQGRRTESAIWSEFSAIHPGCLGALLSAVSTGLRNLPNTVVPDSPRMSDFCAWVVACEPSLPWKQGDFMKAYRQRLTEANKDLAEHDSLTAGLVGWAWEKLKPGEWMIMTAREVLLSLNIFMRDTPIDMKHWPSSPEALAHKLPRLAPLLRAQGLEVSKLPRTKNAYSRWQILHINPQVALAGMEKAA